MSKPSPAPAESAKVAAAVPDYEVKLLLDAMKVLDIELKPTKEADRAFDLIHPSRKIVMQFLDTPRVSKAEEKRQLDAAGWNVRLRRFDDADKVELSYKRRYRIEPGRLTDALALAAQDGFHANERDYDAQVEWGFSRQTLSFTRKKEFKAHGPQSLELPDTESRSLAIREIPGKLDRTKQVGWAKGLLASAHLFGPVLGKRWAGRWQGPGLSFEMWLVRTKGKSGYEPVVELSFKEKTQAEASGSRDKLIAFVSDQGWLLETDALKTGMILDRY